MFIYYIQCWLMQVKIGIIYILLYFYIFVKCLDDIFYIFIEICNIYNIWFSIFIFGTYFFKVILQQFKYVYVGKLYNIVWKEKLRINVYNFINSRMFK